VSEDGEEKLPLHVSLDIPSSNEARNGVFPNTRIYVQYTVGSRFATVRFTTIHFYDPCPVGPNTTDLWCISVATPASFLYLVRFLLFSGVHVFLLIPF